MAPEVLTRTNAEIYERIQLVRPGDLLNFEWTEYIWGLDFEFAKEFLKEGTKPEDYKRVPPTRDLYLKTISDYMAFAWEKANDCRGLSANRSISHMIAWLWLAGEDEMFTRVSRWYSDNYQHYGKEILREICEHYQWDWRSLDNDHWTQGEQDRIGVKAETCPRLT